MANPTVLEPELFNRRVGQRFQPPNGTDISFICSSENGGMFYCKADRDGRPIRATEWIFTRLANHVGIPTPECFVMEDAGSGETFFGSQDVGGTATRFEVQDFLSRPAEDELGRPSPWLRRYLARLYAFDLFAANPDRQISNFLLESSSRRLCAFDFAAGSIDALPTTQFPIEGTHTLRVGRYLRERHGFDRDSALEMVDRLVAVPPGFLETTIGEMPGEWSTSAQLEAIREAWRDPSHPRLSALRAGLTDGSLI